MEIQVRVTPKASRNHIEAQADGSYKVWVTAAPTDGQANAAVCELLSEIAGVPKRDVEVVRGHTARAKLVRVDGVSAQEFASNLEQRGK